MASNDKYKGWFGLVAVLVLLSAGTCTTRANWVQMDKLFDPYGVMQGWFGTSVSIDGDCIVVGVPNDDGNSLMCGAAYVFERNGSNWVGQEKLTAPDGETNDFFGGSVSVSGDYIVMGAHSDNAKGWQSGSAYVFKRSGGNWIYQTKLTASDGDAEDSFGNSVSISGDYLVAGAPGDEINGVFSGSAYVFKRNGDTWVEQARLNASDGEVGDVFGGSVCISGEYVIIGAPEYYKGPLPGDRGSAYVFKRDDQSWPEKMKLTASDGQAGDNLGWSVSINGDWAIAGTPGDDNDGDSAGAAYIFKRDGDDWTEHIRLRAGDAGALGGFGWSVSINAEHAIVGAVGDDEKGAFAGTAYIFEEENDCWRTDAKLIASDGQAYDEFGSSVSISADYVAVGAPYAASNTFESGSAYVFGLCASRLTADLNGDCFVDFTDFGLFVEQWLESGL